jgi:arsenate reductase-like glutaredoxin family protein
MPIPLLFIGAAVVSGAFGVGKSIKAGIDQKDANDTNEQANAIIELSSEKIETCRKNCGDAINNLGTCKVNILDESIKPFVNEFEKLNHIELTESKGLNELQKITLNQKDFVELKKMQSMATSMVGGLASGAVAGAITAFGAYGAVGTFGIASTGTAIASLNGAAATSATLAFFGGGPIAAGGFGVGMGATVLGGLVAGPVLAVLGTVVGANASANKDKAYTNIAKAREFREQIDAASSLCVGIRKRANLFRRFLISLNSIFEPLVYNMSEIIKTRGTDFRTYTDDEKNTVAETMALAGAIKSILDTPILDKDGNLAPESDKIVEATRTELQGIV